MPPCGTQWLGRRLIVPAPMALDSALQSVNAGSFISTAPKFRQPLRVLHRKEFFSEIF